MTVKHLRRAAVAGAMAPILLMLALAAMLAFAFKDMIAANEELGTRYNEQMVLERFPVVLGNFFVPMQVDFLTGDSQASAELGRADEAFQSHLARAAAVRHLDAVDKDVLRGVHDVVEQAITLADEVANGDIDELYAPDSVVIAQHLVLVAQRQIAELNARIGAGLTHGIAETRDRIFVLLGANCAGLVLLALSIVMFRRKVTASLKATVEDLCKRLSKTAEAIMQTVDDQAQMANKDIALVTRLRKRLGDMSDDYAQLTRTADEVEKVTTAMMRASELGLVSAEETGKYLETIGREIDGLEQGYVQAEDQDGKVQRLVDAVRDISDEAHLVALNASIEASSGGKRYALVATQLQNLDQRLREQAQELERVIGDVRAAAQTSLQLTRSGLKEVPSGEAIIKKAGDILQQLQATSARVSETAKNISALARQQHSSGQGVVVQAEDLSRSISEHAEEVRRFREHAFALNKLTEEMQEAL